MHTTDAKGQVITNWVATNDLVIINEGNKPTLVQENYGYILDLTLATVNVARHVNKWDELDMESLSDLNYIIFDGLENKQSRLEHQKN